MEDLRNYRKSCENDRLLKRNREALASCRQSLSISVYQHGNDSVKIISDLIALAGVHYILSYPKSAKELFDDALAIAEKNLPSWDYSIAILHHNIGIVDLSEGRYLESERHHKKSLEICKAISNESCKFDAHERLAKIYRAQGQYVLAEQQLMHIRKIWDSSLDSKDANFAVLLQALGGIYQAQERYDDAAQAFRRALALQQSSLGPLHLSIGLTLDGLASVYLTQGQYEQAETTYKRALRIQDRPGTPKNSDSAISLAGLATVYQAQGKYDEAEKFYNRALSIRQKSLGDEHPVVAGILNNLGELYWRQGEYGKAESFYKRALIIQEKKLTAMHPEIAGTLNNLALLYWAQNQYVSAENFLKRAVTIQEHALGTENPAVARILNSLAMLQVLQGKLESAEVLFERALNIQTRVFGQEHPEIGWSLTNLATLQAKKGNYDQAQRLALSALMIQERKLGIEHPELAGTLGLLADIHQIRARYEEAEALYKRALAILDKARSTDYSAMVHLLNNLARLELSQDHFGEAAAHLLQAQQIVEKLLGQATSESRAAPLLQSSRAEEELFYGLLLRPQADPSLRSAALTLGLLRKGRTMEVGTQASRAILMSLTDATQRASFEKWQRLRIEREALIFSTGEKQASSKVKTQLTNINQQIETLEHNLAAASPLLRSVQPPNWQEVTKLVAQQLPPDSVLLEVVMGRPTQSQAGKLTVGTPHYLVMLLSRDQHIEVVDLGDVQEVDREVVALIRELRIPTSNPMKVAQALYQRFFRALEPHLRTMKHLFLSVEGSWNLIPFAALHDGKRYLLDRYELHYLTSGRDLLRARLQHDSAPVLVLADPDYAGPRLSAAADVSGSGSRAARGLIERLEQLQRLPATRKEAETIARLLPDSQIRMDRDATEQALRQARAPRVLHIATHGLFLDAQAPQEAPKTEVTADASMRSLVPLTPAVSNLSIEHELGRTATFPLSRSLLVLAGANERTGKPGNEQDGLVSAEDVRALNLWGTQLVVLSACDTGRGTVETGQGVYGLRRAFFLAGAETTVTSLWQVADAETGELMKLYYENLVRDEKPRVGAMQEAMLEIRKKKPHPYYWAPFIVMGQDGALTLAPR